MCMLICGSMKYVIILIMRGDWAGFDDEMASFSRD